MILFLTFIFDLDANEVEMKEEPTTATSSEQPEKVSKFFDYFIIFLFYL